MRISAGPFGPSNLRLSRRTAHSCYVKDRKAEQEVNTDQQHALDHVVSPSAAIAFTMNVDPAIANRSSGLSNTSVIGRPSAHDSSTSSGASSGHDRPPAKLQQVAGRTVWCIAEQQRQVAGEDRDHDWPAQPQRPQCGLHLQPTREQRCQGEQSDHDEQQRDSRCADCECHRDPSYTAARFLLVVDDVERGQQAAGRSIPYPDNEQQVSALMGRDGSLDRLCWPRFESPALFCRPVGRPGERAIANSAQDGTARTSRAYRQNTLILGTQFETDGGAVLLSDFMPLRGANSDVVRRVTGLRGRVAMKLELIVRFDYGRTVPWGSRLDDGCLRLTAGPNMLILRSDVELAGRTWLRSASSRSRPHESPHFFLTRSSPVSQPLRRPCL
jgi:hypothetical protein